MSYNLSYVFGIPLKDDKATFKRQTMNNSFSLIKLYKTEFNFKLYKKSNKGNVKS